MASLLLIFGGSVRSRIRVSRQASAPYIEIYIYVVYAGWLPALYEWCIMYRFAFRC